LDKLSGFAKGVTSMTDPAIGNVCQEVRDFLVDLRRHENEENKLAQTAFVDDLGMVD
jgi:hypothetical protein